MARQTVRERLTALRAAIEAEVRRRTAAEKGRDKVAKNAVRPLADQVDFLRAQSGDLAELRRAVAPLARRLAVRLSARRRLGREGRLDFRKTVRASLGTGGVPVVTHHRPRKVHKPELVVLCDVSGSVAGFSHFTLMLTQALREHFTGVRAFAFVDSTDEVTRFFRPGADVVDAVQRIGREADVVAFDGHSDYGTAFEVFADRWPAAVGPKTSLLVLGDGRTNYRPPGLPVLADLVRRSRSAHWLNPEPRRQWGSGDSAARPVRRGHRHGRVPQRRPAGGLRHHPLSAGRRRRRRLDMPTCRRVDPSTGRSSDRPPATRCADGHEATTPEVRNPSASRRVGQRGAGATDRRRHRPCHGARPDCDRLHGGAGRGGSGRPASRWGSGPAGRAGPPGPARRLVAG